MHRSFRVAVTAAAICLFLGTAGWLDAKTETSELALVRAKVRLRTSGAEDSPRDSVRLVLRMQGRVLPRSWDPRLDEALITIGGRPVIQLPTRDPYTVARIRDDRWVYREKRSPDRVARRKLVVDYKSGRIVLHAKRLDLSGIDMTHLALKVTLDGKTWELSAPVFQEGSHWIFSGRPMLFSLPGGDPDPDPGPGPGPTPDPDPDPDPDPGPKPDITWQELVWSHDSVNSIPDQVVADTQAGYDALWSRTGRPLPKPTVDFTKHMVVGIFAGNVRNAKVAIQSVKREGSEVVVTYRIVPDTNRYLVPPPPYPHYLFTMTKTDEKIRFSLVP